MYQQDNIIAAVSVTPYMISSVHDICDDIMYNAYTTKVQYSQILESRIEMCDLKVWVICCYMFLQSL